MDIESSPSSSGATSANTPIATRDERLANSVKTVLNPLHATIDPDDEPDASRVYERNIPNVMTDMEHTGAPLASDDAANYAIAMGKAYDEDAVRKFTAKKRSNTASVYLLYVVGVLILINVAVFAVIKLLLH